MISLWARVTRRGSPLSSAMDDVLITELYDPNPLVGGAVGFSPYCTKLRIKDIEVREIKWEDFPQVYEPEF